jgi:hypothetical protein
MQNEFKNTYNYIPSLFGFDIGLRNCLIILAGYTIALRILSLCFLKFLITKF